MAFDMSMGGGEKEFRPDVLSADDGTRYAKFKEVYEKVTLSRLGSSTAIPKIFHQIWIGPKSPPEYLFAYQQHLKNLHPDWEYHLWSDAELEGLDLEDWDLVEKSSNFGEKADIVRSNLLDRFGGVCLDADVKVCCPLDELVEKLDFFAGLECPRVFVGTHQQLWIGVAVIGVRPGHPIIKEWRRRIRHGWDEVDQWCSSPIERVMHRTYYPFTHAVIQEIQRDGNTDIVFPATYFFPVSPEYAKAVKKEGGVDVRRGVRRVLELLKLRDVPPFSKVRPETIAAHYCEEEWQKDESEMTNNVVQLTELARKDLDRLSQRVKGIGQRVTALEHDVEKCVKEHPDLSGSISG
jgi:hypothetical protein